MHNGGKIFILSKNLFLLFSKLKPYWCKNVLCWFQIVIIADSITQTPYLNLISTITQSKNNV